MNLRCVIIDDEYLAIRVLEGFCARIPGIRLLGSFKDPREAMRFLGENEVDLIFLDIQMPHISGVELAGRVLRQDRPERGPLLVFTTARHEFAVEAFELEALDYLVKPIAFERFARAVRKAGERLSQPPFPAAGADGAREVEERVTETTPAEADSLLVRSDHRTLRLSFGDIVLIEGLNEYVRVHTPDKKIITLAALRDLEARLPAERFVRIHRSFIVSLAHIRSWNATMVEMGGGLRLPVGRVYKEGFLQAVRLVGKNGV